jgi:hypothetical protein
MSNLVMCAFELLEERCGVSGDRTYKLHSGITSEPGRYVKSLGEPVTGNYGIRCPLTCGHGSFYITQGDSLRASVSSEQDSPIVRRFRKFNEVTGLSVDARVRVAAP